MVCARRRWYQWRLPEMMIERELFAADLVRLMAARGIGLSAMQAWRLASRTPSGLSLTVLAGLCDALGVTPNELITVIDSSRFGHALEERSGNCRCTGVMVRAFSTLDARITCLVGSCQCTNVASGCPVSTM